MLFEERIIDTILNVIKDNQTYLTQKENLPQLAKLGYMYNTLWYGGRCASYEGVIDKIKYEEEGEETWWAEQCSDNPKYKIEMCEPENEEIENYIYDAWGMHVSNGYGPGWEEFHQIMTSGKPLSELELKELKPNKTFDEWVEILTDPNYMYSSLYPDRRSVANHLLCVIGNGYGFKNGFIIKEASGADQDTTDYGDWMNAKFREDIQVIVDTIMSDPEVEKVLRYIDVKSSILKAEKLEQEIKSFGMSYEDFLKSSDYNDFFGKVNTKFEYYPICQYSIIKNLNKQSDPSYIKAAIEICEDILANPPKYKKKDNKFQKDQCDEQVKFAQNFLNEFKTYV
jgi:hypothetical protein